MSLLAGRIGYVPHAASGAALQAGTSGSIESGEAHNPGLRVSAVRCHETACVDIFCNLTQKS